MSSFDYTERNGDLQVDIGNFWEHNLKSDVDGIPELYTDITLSGCISGRPTDLILSEQPDQLTTGFFHIDDENFSFIIDIADSTAMDKGLYKYAIYGTPLNGETYTIQSGNIEFKETARC